MLGGLAWLSRPKIPQNDKSKICQGFVLISHKPCVHQLYNRAYFVTTNHTSCAQVHELPQSHCGDTQEGISFSWWHIYYVHFASVRFERSVCRGWLMTTYIYMYIYIYIYFMVAAPYIMYKTFQLCCYHQHACVLVCLSLPSAYLSVKLQWMIQVTREIQSNPWIQEFWLCCK